MGIVRLPRHDSFWSIKSLFHGLWAREIIGRDRFKALLAMLHVADRSQEEKGDKMRKITPFINHFRNMCRELFQPQGNLAIEKRVQKINQRITDQLA